ncbi:class I SAM-dependent DNA methyltransferase [Falsirhodobacter sp. 20TX0035]|uniref:class I SAM-dependent DNA methyltransferase n=1 Tax=Falsirhodobacter sp. 20TX0035 TaxID=3022019 RepID=UPI00232D9068|nr:DNA methyltransferase [Falsirhodobacter sp. 20TX0035]MDB6455161.1 lactate dehydrogenase [Falsirhodobacter sp. 20TX0035]
MNPVEIEQAISDLAEAPFDAAAFPYAFLEAFGRKETEIKKLRKGDTNKSDLGGVLQRNNIHMATCAPGEVSQTLAALKDSPATTKHKAKFILATDGQTFEAEDLIGGDTVACAYKDFPNSFGVFLPLAGISTVKQIKESAFDIKATGRLNRLYVELLKDNPAWGKAERRHDMNHFMARLIFCFFAEDTDIFTTEDLFTGTIDRMSNRYDNTHEVISEIFRAMNVPLADRASANLPRWADAFPYVNGGLFSGSTEVPRFSKIAQRYLSHIGGLDWTKINPDIFGSMIQAVADEGERSVLGMHYTSVPNILKVLNPLFLDDLNAALEEAGDNARKLLNLRGRIAKIRVFDPACGSGNFLVIAYKQLRSIEAEINRRRGETDRKTDIPLTNFRGIEIRDFSAEIARLALIIAEYQCDVTYRGQKEALAEFLPLDSQNWITCGNALRLDWLSLCPPTGTGVKVKADDLFQTPFDQAKIDFENEGGETYICGNPPYLGSTWQSTEQKEDLGRIFGGRTTTWKSLDYVAGWFMKAADYGIHTPTVSAFVSTNSICQGQQVSTLWPLIFKTGHKIAFAHTSFKWANLASHNAGVTVAIVAITNIPRDKKLLCSLSDEGENILKEVDEINAYLVGGANVIVNPSDKVLGGMGKMDNGNKPVDGGHLLLEPDEVATLNLTEEDNAQLVRKYVGSQEAINGKLRYCLWITDETRKRAENLPAVAARISLVREERLRSPKKMTRDSAAWPHAFQQVRQTGEEILIVVPRVSSENRAFLPCSLMEPGAIMSDKVFALYDAPLWNMALIASRLHWVWIGTVCVRMRTDFSYSNTLGWNTFPVPKLTEKNREDLTHCAEDILLAREAHFPATIADLYDPEKMPANLRAAHDRNDETLERIYIGRRFKNDTERLEKLFDMYTKMTTKVSA